MNRLAAIARPSVPLDGVECRDISVRAGNDLGLPLVIAVSLRPAGIEELSPGERRHLATFTTRERAVSWLRGRAALKVLIGPFGDQDTTRIAFPNPRFSLTHSGDVAVALACRSERALGVGVDLEWDRPAPDRAARFYLSASEAHWVGRLDAPERAGALLRLWTIKEALFKADPSNANTLLSDYRLSDPSRNVGVTSTAEVDLRWLCVRIRGGYLSLAIAMRRR
jgi:hypothetical protein